MSIIIICVFIVLFGALVKNILVGQHTRKAIDIIFSKLDWEHLNKIYLEEVSYESRFFNLKMWTFNQMFKGLDDK